MCIRHLRAIAAGLGITILAALAAAGLLVGLGLYNVAADSPHTPMVYWLMQTARDNSVTLRAREIVPPSDLGDAKRIATGAGLYQEMCSGCHIGPGLEPTEISQGLYPAAPQFAKGFDLPPAEAFWIIKHGLKMTGMAAWGPTHSDTLIWDMVAFLEKMPGLSTAQYQALVKNAPADHDEMMKDDMPGMTMGH
jgi:mono/diheme cytochrome c family protein